MKEKKIFTILIWTFTLLAFMFFFLSLRSETNEMMYSFIALAMWGVAFLINKFKRNEKKE